MYLQKLCQGAEKMLVWNTVGLERCLFSAAIRFVAGQMPPPNHLSCPSPYLPPLPNLSLARIKYSDYLDVFLTKTELSLTYPQSTCNPL